MSQSYTHEKKHAFEKVFFSLPAQLTAVAFLAGMVLYTALLSGYAPVHDALHELRHALMFIPCH
ncbi:CbtB domain-containing protein [Paenibacillus naphthalenovorans]|uniref:CbtB domain-containing protein n=1 Tax=Paenibacillus naphthalenovorans TaxID=162209 RepID=UPI003D2C3800